MESQTQPPTDDASNPSALATAFSPEARRKISPTTQSIAKGKWIVTQIFDFIVGLPNYVGSSFNQSKQLITSVGLIIATAIVLKVVLAILDALNDIPVVAPTLELIGVGYSAWFISRYLFRASNRQELVQQTQRVLNEQGKDAATRTEGGQINKLQQNDIASTESEQMNQQEKDTMPTIENKEENGQLYKPGEIVPTSGRYELMNADGSSKGREVTSTKGEHFPPTPESEMHYKLVDPTHHKNQSSLNQQENDASTTTGNQQLYKPGEIVPESGQYELISADGSSEGREVTSTKGEHFPPAPESGMHYKLVDPTHHKK
ncbi:MAG: hypothetical protein KME05_19560 [Gloeocapsa sp. UFS-A4-WI-NPMV-4B04]|jgi:hypothetical protein|nr:hypothetical protein [Gloeocapsa sp. UFS-A4-WI-NPMV-4B04]